jgi:hypothetical protein
MKIESILRRSGGTHVTFSAGDRWPWPAGQYHFAPETDDPNAPYVCEVIEEAHIQRLLTMTGSFRMAQDGGVQVQIQRPAATVAPIAPSAQPQTEPTADSPEFIEMVAEVRELTVRALKATINTKPIEVLKSALEAERASGDPRKSWIDVVEAHVGDR